MAEPQLVQDGFRIADHIGAAVGGGSLLGAGGLALLFKDTIKTVVDSWREERLHKREMQLRGSGNDAITAQLIALLRQDSERNFQTLNKVLDVLKSDAVNLENITASMRAQTQKIEDQGVKLGGLHDELGVIKGIVLGQHQQ